ncbi:hypothetical protein Hanom_Chr05g00391851 [Helianthus anomalus]
MLKNIARTINTNNINIKLIIISNLPTGDTRAIMAQGTPLCSRSPLHTERLFGHC